MQSAEFNISRETGIKNKMLNWANRFNIFVLLDNNQYQFEAPAFEWLIAAGVTASLQLDHPVNFSDVQEFHEKNPGWIFGHINYPDTAPDSTGFPSLYFFQPSILLRVSNGQLKIESRNKLPGQVYQEILNASDRIPRTVMNVPEVRHRISRDAYLETLQALHRHIKRGDCYEINFCQEFYSENAIVSPLDVFHRLNNESPNPFAAFYKLNHSYCMCASPERFLKKSGDTLWSQPIKGTSKRNLQDEVADKAAKDYLLESTKEKSENVMVVDLVRNDMSHFCTEGSVRVTELFGIYSFPQVHQMISTIQGRVPENMHWSSMVAPCFPMGSMTGAPKVKVMELIKRYEGFARGLFSGAIGYVTPEGDFDFNVVIRSLFYNDASRVLSFKAGSGITFYSDASNEYEECMMKAAAIMKVIGSD